MSQPGDSYPQDPSNWIPRTVFVEESPRTHKLLELERQRDNILGQIAEERLRVLGREPTHHYTDQHYYAFGVSQMLFDILGHYGNGQVRKAVLGWLFWNGTDDLSESAKQELNELLRNEVIDKAGDPWKTSNRWTLKPRDGTYVFPDLPKEEKAE
jgi:hypothetical protein